MKSDKTVSDVLNRLDDSATTCFRYLMGEAFAEHYDDIRTAIKNTNNELVVITEDGQIIRGKFDVRVVDKSILECEIDD